MQRDFGRTEDRFSSCLLRIVLDAVPVSPFCSNSALVTRRLPQAASALKGEPSVKDTITH